AAIGYFTGYEVGWIAWGIGALAGLGLAFGVGDDSDAGTGGIAAMVAVAAILAGKFAVAHLLVNQELDTLETSMTEVSSDDSKLYMADQLVTEYESTGKAVNWPAGMTIDDADEPADYPADLWKDTEARWKTMTPEAQEEYRVGVEEQNKIMFESFRTEVTSSAFMDSFALWDVLWVILAVLSAFKIGSGAGGSDD
ncbi:MAG: hypothetical protein PSX37_12245, partial [bacterium]|nr:hypothetical protein [bacterium]